MILTDQTTVQFSTALIFVLSLTLVVSLTASYRRTKATAHLFWSIGLWLFTLSVLEEIAFAFGFYGNMLIKSYLGIVAILVQFLALGSIQIVKSQRLKYSYYIFSLLATFLLAYSLTAATVGNVLDNYVVFGTLPNSIIIASSVITFPAAVILIVVAAISFKRSRSRKMLSIIAGVVVVSIAGSLYIAQFPSFLYYSEFIGILLLWFGFFNMPRRNKSEVSQHVKNPQQTSVR